MRKLILILTLITLFLACSLKAYKVADDWAKRPERDTIRRHYKSVGY